MDKTPFFEYGFWWWYNPEKKDWFVGCAPSFGLPKWWDPKWDRPKFKFKFKR